MDIIQLCEHCHEKRAVATCEVCGAQVCSEHKRDHGCDVCGGESKFD